MDSDFIIKKDFFLKVKRQPFRDHYFIHPKKLGQGSMGQVYRVRAQDPPVWRAAKSIKKKDITNKEELLNQIAILKALDHPNIIKIYDIYEDEDELFLVQDLCEGGELFDKLMKVQKFTQMDARRIFRQLVETLNYCHNNHVVHRDLKPQNILFLKKDSLDLKLIDFGVSFLWEKSMKDELKCTNTKTFVGTAYYVAPEILINSNQYDQKCDIWSLGVILYILLSSLPPFDGDSPSEIFGKIKNYNYSLNIPELKNVTNQVKDLMKKIFVPPSQRIGLQQILKHPWMTCEPNPIAIKLNIKALTNFSKFTKTKKLSAEFLASQLQPSQVQQLSKIFKQLDLNKDGEISMEELKQALNKEGLGYAELRRVMDSIDTDHNGKINYTQFLASASGDSLFSEQNIKRAFRMLDKDGNGVVQRQELIDLFSESGMTAFKGRTVDQIMEECDKDGNGVIDFQEFKNCIKKK